MTFSACQCSRDTKKPPSAFKEQILSTDRLPIKLVQTQIDGQTLHSNSGAMMQVIQMSLEEAKGRLGQFHLAVTTKITSPQLVHDLEYTHDLKYAPSGNFSTQHRVIHPADTTDNTLNASSNTEWRIIGRKAFVRRPHGEWRVKPFLYSTAEHEFRLCHQDLIDIVWPILEKISPSAPTATTYEGREAWRYQVSSSAPTHFKWGITQLDSTAISGTLWVDKQTGVLLSTTWQIKALMPPLKESRLRTEPVALKAAPEAAAPEKSEESADETAAPEETAMKPVARFKESSYALSDTTVSTEFTLHLSYRMRAFKAKEASELEPHPPTGEVPEYVRERPAADPLLFWKQRGAKVNPPSQPENNQEEESINGQ